MANTLKVTAENEDVLTHSVINGVDGSNLIADGKTAVFNGQPTYTATQDCWMSLYWSTNIGSVNIDGGNIWFGQSQNWGTFWFPLRKGQTLTLGALNQLGPNGTNNCVRVYGVKR